MKMVEKSSLLSKKLPLPRGLERFFGDDTVRIRRAAFVVGVMEGVAIFRYEILQDDFSFVPLLTSVGFVAINTIASVVLWTLFGTVIGRFLKRDEWVFRLCFAIWAAVVALGRYLLDDRTVDWGWSYWLAGVALAYLAPLHLRGRVWNILNPTLEVIAVILVTGFSLLGRVPDYSYPLWQTIVLLGSSAVIAVVAYAAMVRVQPVLAVAVVLFVLLGLLPAATNQK
ncbi:MAG: hypothetical protein JRF63_09710, partial [Deltaproteobacteria bacterium]|nr:hypothetical protein [Deltaproteobacteria bacterium]